MPDRDHVSLFIPIYNAAFLIKKCLRKSYDALMSIDDTFEIFLIDDHSNDKSYRFSRVLKKAETISSKKIKYIQFSTGPSRRENLAQSFSSASHEIVAFMDADLACDVSFLSKAVQVLIEQKCDIVIGSRYTQGAKIKRSPLRLLYSKVYNTMLKVLFQSKIQDHQCGLKVFRKAALMPLLQSMGYDHSMQRGWFWDAELLIRAQRSRLSIIEMPVEWNEAETSTFKFTREIRCLWYIWKLFLSSRTERPRR